ncbi:MAG: hypothetical protein ACRCUT_00640 [Spirochaetota bacterium]
MGKTAAVYEAVVSKYGESVAVGICKPEKSSDPTPSAGFFHQLEQMPAVLRLIRQFAVEVIKGADAVFKKDFRSFVMHRNERDISLLWNCIAAVISSALALCGLLFMLVFLF